MFWEENHFSSESGWLDNLKPNGAGKTNRQWYKSYAFPLRKIGSKVSNMSGMVVFPVSEVMKRCLIGKKKKKQAAVTRGFVSLKTTQWFILAPVCVSACLVLDNIGQRNSIMTGRKRGNFVSFYSNCGYWLVCLPVCKLFSKYLLLARGPRSRTLFCFPASRVISTPVARLMGHTVFFFWGRNMNYWSRKLVWYVTFSGYEVKKKYLHIHTPRREHTRTKRCQWGTFTQIQLDLWVSY